MKKLLVVLLLSGCTTPYNPTTKAGASCKVQCAANMQSCGASSYTCDRSYNRCVEACKDVDRLN